jgi:hypothetical protein
MPRAARYRIAATMTAVALAVGCSDDAGGDGDDTADSSRTDDARAFGEPHEADGLAVTPIDVRAGTVADLAGVDLDPDEVDDTPYFVRYQVENTGTETIETGVEIASSLSLLGDDDQPLQELAVLGVVDACAGAFPPEPFGPGAAYEDCDIFLAPEGTTPTALVSDLGPGTTWEVTDEDLATPSDGEVGADPLRVGEPFRFPDDGSEAAGTTVTLVEVTAGTSADLAGVDLAAEERQHTPYYVRLQLQDEDRTPRDIERASLDFRRTLVGRDNQPLQPLSLLAPTGSFPLCETPSRADDTGAAGDVFETCDIFLAPPGTEPAAFQFTYGGQVTWSL